MGWVAKKNGCGKGGTGFGIATFNLPHVWSRGSGVSSKTGLAIWESLMVEIAWTRRRICSGRHRSRAHVRCGSNRSAGASLPSRSPPGCSIPAHSPFWAVRCAAVRPSRPNPLCFPVLLETPDPQSAATGIRTPDGDLPDALQHQVPLRVSRGLFSYLCFLCARSDMTTVSGGTEEVIQQLPPITLPLPMVVWPPSTVAPA